MSEATLKDGEFHPVAESALVWFQNWRTKNLKDYMMLRESVASTAIEGNRTAELLNSTLNRLDSGQPVSDRYLLALCWFIRFNYLADETENS